MPPVAPRVGWFNQVRLGRDYYVRVDSNDYSVDPAAIGRQLTVTAGLRVQVRLNGLIVADRPLVWARHMTVTDPAHVAIAQQLREEFARPRTRDNKLERDLADYDEAFGRPTRHYANTTECSTTCGSTGGGDTRTATPGLGPGRAALAPPGVHGTLFGGAGR